MGSTERKPARPAADRNEADRAAEALWRQLERRYGLTIRAVRPDLDVEAQARVDGDQTDRESVAESLAKIVSALETRGLPRPGSTRECAS